MGDGLVMAVDNRVSFTDAERIVLEHALDLMRDKLLSQITEALRADEDYVEDLTDELTSVLRLRKRLKRGA